MLDNIFKDELSSFSINKYGERLMKSGGNTSCACLLCPQ